MTAMTDAASKKLAATDKNDDANDKEYECYKIAEQVMPVWWSDKS